MKNENQINRRGLHNVVRETLLQRGGNHAKAALVVDACMWLRLQPGSLRRFDSLQAQLQDEFGISHRTVYDALHCRSVFFRMQAQTEGRGRKPYLYRIPSPGALAVELGVDHKIRRQNAHWRDQLKRSDFETLTTYRMALQRQLVKRMAADSDDDDGAAMGRQLQADRLGVSTRTVRRYDARLQTRITPQYDLHIIDESNYKKLPTEKPARGAVWLEIVGDGTYWQRQPKAYPLLQSIASMALLDGCTVYAKRRRHNRYAPAAPRQLNFKSNNLSEEISL